jgi:hypothetical protein
MASPFAEAVRALAEIGQRAGALIDPDTIERDDEWWQQAIRRRGRSANN